MRFVHEFHNQNAAVRSSEELLDNLQKPKGVLCGERKVTPRSEETWAAHRTKEMRAGSHPCSKQGIPVHKENCAHE